MNRLARLVPHTLSLRISIMVVSAIALLLLAALLVMFSYSRRAIKEEAMQKANQTLEATVQQIDNILLSVEQSAGNVYWNMLSHMDDSLRMYTYVRRLVETNPYIEGATVALRPNYYPGGDTYFMAYVHHRDSAGRPLDNGELICANSFSNRPYTEQSWYTKPLVTGSPCWVNPLKDGDSEGVPLITFSLPIYNRAGRFDGVLAVDVALSVLSDVVLAAKPSENAYAVMLGSDGSYIVHPDSTKLYHHTIFSLDHSKTDHASIMEAGRAMINGETGYKRFLLNGRRCYVFYQPFRQTSIDGRAHQDLGWSIGVIHPEHDIFQNYNLLLFAVLAIAIVSLLVLAVLCKKLMHRRLVHLRLLTNSAQRIAEGHYNNTIPDTHQQDEVGRLQVHFQQMQQSLAAQMDELERLTQELKERGEVLSAAYEKSKEADRVKTAFLHHMSNQMLEPVSTILDCVQRLRRVEQGETLSHAEAEQQTIEIDHQGKIVTDLLNNILNQSSQ